MRVRRMKRKYMRLNVFGALLFCYFAALFGPPDFFTQIVYGLVALAMYLLIWFGWTFATKKLGYKSKSGSTGADGDKV